MSDSAQLPAAPSSAKLQIGDKTLDLAVVVGSEGEHSVDVSKLRDATGYITLDEGYRNTGAVKSGITFIDGEQGILRYRGYDIAEVAQNATFIETAQLLFHGDLPTAEAHAHFTKLLSKHDEQTFEDIVAAMSGLPATSHPMATLSAMINLTSGRYSDSGFNNKAEFEEDAARLMGKVIILAAAAYRTSAGLPILAPKAGYSYCENFLYMLFSTPTKAHVPDPDVVDALDKIFILHADHEQNCSTSTVRMVGSSGASMSASCAAGVCALWGPLHGGANAEVLERLEYIHQSGMTPAQFLERVKNKQEKLYGFGHAVYKNFDPRSRVLKKAADKVLAKLHVNDPLLDIAKQLEDAALNEEYFKSRNLYPNVDFYSGIIMRALGIPTNMFTVLFAIGRMPGWIAQWKEVRDSKSKIYRPRQVYVGPAHRAWKK